MAKRNYIFRYGGGKRINHVFKVFKRENGEHIKIACWKTNSIIPLHLIEIKVFKNNLWVLDDENDTVTDQEKEILYKKYDAALKKKKHAS